MWNRPKTELSLLWYDYETWGANPQRDRIAQFAAVRTDLELNPLGEPIDLLCKPMIDAVIDPGAVAITHLSPITLNNEGLSEWDFAHQIHQHMSLTGTCTVGYNTIRFDDECTRYLFYRNLLDPYAREWKNGNSRWDILDIVRMTKALRPQGIVWPTHDDGSPSFKLEHLTAANGIAHENAHDAVSDVLATIAMAKLIKDQQPRLFSYAFGLRSKHEVRQHIDTEKFTPHLHFTGKIPALEHCMGIEVALLIHPDRANEAIVIDIREDPSWLLKCSADELRKWLYTKTDELPEGVSRPPFKTIHINRSPMIAPMSLLTDEVEQRLKIDVKKIMAHRDIVANNATFSRLALEVFSTDKKHEPHEDPEHALYAGFIDGHDRGLLNSFVADKTKKDQWLHESHLFHDARIPPLVLNVLARHFPDNLTDLQLNEWKNTQKSILNNPNAGQALTVSDAILRIDELIEQQPESTAFADTRTYLTEFKNAWFGSPVTTITGEHGGAEAIDGNYSTDQESDPSDKPNLNDQLDLF